MSVCSYSAWDSIISKRLSGDLFWNPTELHLKTLKTKKSRNLEFEIIKKSGVVSESPRVPIRRLTSDLWPVRESSSTFTCFCFAGCRFFLFPQNASVVEDPQVSGDDLVLQHRSGGNIDAVPVVGDDDDGSLAKDKVIYD